MGRDLKGKELGAGFSQMKNGLYRRTYKLNGKQCAVYGSTMKECRKKYSDQLQRIEAGIISKDTTLNAYYAEWMKNRTAAGEIKQSSTNSYNLWFRHISKAFGTRKVSAIKPADVKRFQRELIGQYAPKTVNSITDLLHLLFESMVQDELVLRNPVVLKHVKPAADAPERTNNRALTADELRIFLHYAQDQYYYPAIRLLFATGMRAGELRGLKWSDYDEAHRVFHIRRTASVDQEGKLCMNTPKSKSGIRDIPVNDQIAEIIESRRQQRNELEGNVRRVDDFMFKSINGKVISRNVLKSAFETICARINADGIPFDRISPHACRHTFITMALHEGLNEYVIKDIVGHAPSAKVTTDVYLDRDQNCMRDAMNEIHIAI